MRIYRNGKEASNPKSLSRGVIKKDSAKFKTVERVNDPEGKFARSIKANYVDSDGDGFPDSYEKNYRAPVAGKVYKATSTTTVPLPPQFAPTDITATDTTNWTSGLTVSDLGTSIQGTKTDGRTSYNPGETVQWYGIPVIIISMESNGTYTIEPV